MDVRSARTLWVALQRFTRSISQLHLTAPRTMALYALLLLLCAITTIANAQQRTVEPGTSSSSLPTAPLPKSDHQSAVEQTPSAQGSASVSGVVLDISGAAVPGAQVSLTHKDGTQLRMLNSGGNGEFAFTKLPAGSYLVIVSARVCALHICRVRRNGATVL